MLTEAYSLYIPRDFEMAREGTRSATGNSKPRVFPVVDTAPAVKRTNTKPKTTKAAPATKKTAAKPTGVTKKKAAPKKESGVAKKVHISWSIERQASRPRDTAYTAHRVAYMGHLANLHSQVKAVAKKVEKKTDKAEKVSHSFRQRVSFQVSTPRGASHSCNHPQPRDSHILPPTYTYTPLH
jgi:hypothetical protein